MLSAHNVRPEAAASYYETDDPYYSKGEDGCGSVWDGILAKEMGLTGTVIDDDFRTLIHGRDPEGVRVRGVNNNGGTKTRGGCDLTFSAPKSVSIEALVWGNKKVTAVHHAAVKETLKEIEAEYSTVEIRTGGKRRQEVTGKLAIAIFAHATSRSLDPQLHSHAIIMNTSMCSDGKYRALRNEGFFRDNRRDMGINYQDKLAKGLEELGYKVDRKDNGTIEIAGYTREQVTAFSKRTQKIEEVAEREGATGWRDVKHISLQQRPAKRHVDKDVLENRWEKKAKEVQLNGPILKNKDKAKDREDIQVEPKVKPKPKQKVTRKVPGRAAAPKAWTKQALLGIEYLRPRHIEKEHWLELVKDSAIEPRIAAKYFASVNGPQAEMRLLNYAMGQFSGNAQQHATKPVQKIRERYKHLEEGGMWCEGKPQNREPWGQLKPNNPISEDKHADRFVVKLKDGRVRDLPKPKGYKPEIKTRKYESIPKAYKRLEAHKSHFAFTRDMGKAEKGDGDLWITEGAKKGAALHTHGLDALALNGVNGGYGLNDNGERELGEHLKAYDWKNRTVVLCFDKDPPEKVKTVRNVAIAMHRFGRLLEQEGATVVIAEMPGNDRGKTGVDDFLAKGKSIDDLKFSTLDNWTNNSPYLQKELAMHEAEMEYRAQINSPYIEEELPEIEVEENEVEESIGLQDVEESDFDMDY